MSQWLRLSIKSITLKLPIRDWASIQFLVHRFYGRLWERKGIEVSTSVPCEEETAYEKEKGKHLSGWSRKLTPESVRGVEKKKEEKEEVEAG